MEPTEAYEVLGYVPARSLPYNQPGTCYTLVALPKEDPTAGEPPGLLGAPGSGGEGGLCTSRLSPVRASAPGGRSREEDQPAWALDTAAHPLLTYPAGQRCCLSYPIAG